MGYPNMIGVSAFDSDNIDDLLEQFDSYIVTYAKEIAYHGPKIAELAILDLEIDEVIQNVRVKLWRALQERRIEYPQSYIRRMVRNEFIDFLRRGRNLLPLPTDDDGELYQGDVMITPSAGMSDPANEFERKWAADNCMTRAVDAVSTLPPRQQRAMIHSLAERVDDFIQLVDAFNSRSIDISALAEWPHDEVEVHRLKASIAPARHAIAERMGVQLSEYKKRGAGKTPLFYITEIEPSSDSTSF